MADNHDDRHVLFFDIDNTLYSASSLISHAMGVRIHAYFMNLGFSDEEANDLHRKYYKTYGLALRGLTRHHEVDPLDFNEKCDGSLPLEEMIKPNPSHRKLLQDINRSKARVWALTNAYVTHAQRVLKILGLEDQIEGVIYCDYTKPNFSCKPETEYYNDALIKANISDPSKCFFVDDSRINAEAAKRLGWGNVVHFCETHLQAMEGGQMKALGSDQSEMEGVTVISDLEELRTVWSSMFISND